MKKLSESINLKLLQYIFFGGILLYVGAPLFVPLAYALFISFILYPISYWLEKRGLPRFLAITFSLLLLIILVGGLGVLLYSQAKGFLSHWQNLRPLLTNAIAQIESYLRDTLNVPVAITDKWMENIMNSLGMQLFTGVGSTVYGSLVSSVKLFLIPVYTALILYNRKQLLDFIFSLFPDENRAQISNILHEAVYTFHHFIKGMITVYIIVGTLNSIGLYFLGVPNAILFGFIASILTFIPYVGIIVGSLLPVTIAWAIHGNILYALGVVAVFAFVQVLEANVIFPLAVSHRLKLSTLFTLLAIFAGGILWGVSGMILFIPTLGIIKLILEKLPAYQNIAKLLAE
jgi:predicted PurR-regulated permease PerM